MTLDELLAYIAEEEESIKQRYKSLTQDYDHEKWVYAKAVKLSEEVGEFSEAVLAHFSRQHMTKSVKHMSVDEELADVIFTALLVGHSLDINVEEAILNKIKKNRQKRLK